MGKQITRLEADSEKKGALPEGRRRNTCWVYAREIWVRRGKSRVKCPVFEMMTLMGR